MADQSTTGERVVHVSETMSNLMYGDPDIDSPKYKGRALPQLLHEGWTVKMIGVDHVVLTGKATPVTVEPGPPEPIVYQPSPRTGGSGRGRGGDGRGGAYGD